MATDVGSPVFSTDDSRILPEVATGTMITSNEIEGLELNAGRFTACQCNQVLIVIAAALKSIDVWCKLCFHR
jgi:imipenem/basic amino acid-specific outer membrane pore